VVGEVLVLVERCWCVVGEVLVLVESVGVGGEVEGGQGKGRGRGVQCWVRVCEV
jgi:hypothetical protein